MRMVVISLVLKLRGYGTTLEQVKDSVVVQDKLNRCAYCSRSEELAQKARA